MTIGASDFPVFRQCLVQSTILRTAAALRKLKPLPFRMFALRLISGFRRLGFLVVTRILSGKVRCAYRYENGCNIATFPPFLDRRAHIYAYWMMNRWLLVLELNLWLSLVISDAFSRSVGEPRIHLRREPDWALERTGGGLRVCYHLECVTCRRWR